MSGQVYNGIWTATIEGRPKYEWPDTGDTRDLGPFIRQLVTEAWEEEAVLTLTFRPPLPQFRAERQDA